MKVFSITSLSACGPVSYTSRIVPNTAAAQEVPKNRYEKLETRISSYLASLLRCTTFYRSPFVQMNSKQCSRTKVRHLPTSSPYQVFRLLRCNPNRRLFRILLASRTPLYPHHLQPSILPTLDFDKTTNHLRSPSPDLHHLLKASSHQPITKKKS